MSLAAEIINVINQALSVAENFNSVWFQKWKVTERKVVGVNHAHCCFENFKKTASPVSPDSFVLANYGVGHKLNPDSA